MPEQAQYIMIGGFLGAGKSTAVLALAEHMNKQGKRVGLITNDQSVGLVDTAMMKSAGHSVEEISGGCFCCRFDSLVQAADRLGESSTPDVFIAEPVGSCTDLVATVSYPLRRIYGERYRVAPLSVLVDPIRAERILGLTEGGNFTEKVVYVYRKQLEEADIIVINKTDLIDADRVDQLRAALSQLNSRARIVAVSVRDKTGLNDWFNLIDSTNAPELETMPIDYDIYAEGEALLGWFNGTVKLHSDKPFDGEVIMMDLAEAMRTDLAEMNAEIAHLKMTLVPDHHGGRTATLNVVRNDYIAELAQSLIEKMRSGLLIVNVRAEGDPDELARVVQRGMELVIAKHGGSGGVCITLEHEEHFRPGRPTPTWRMPDAQKLVTEY